VVILAHESAHSGLALALLAEVSLGARITVVAIAFHGIEHASQVRIAHIGCAGQVVVAIIVVGIIEAASVDFLT